MKPDESIATFCHDIEELLTKEMPGLEEESKSSLLRTRLIANVSENVKNFMDLLSDKSWKQWDQPEEEVKSLKVAVECNGSKIKSLERVGQNFEFGGLKTKVDMLIDSGSSGSFINPTKLPVEMQKYLQSLKSDKEQMINKSFTVTVLNIKSALSTKQSGILGIDFLMKFDAILDYKHSRVTIKHEENEVHLNYINESQSESMDYKVLTTVKKIDKAKTDFKLKANYELIRKETLFEPVNTDEWCNNDLVIGQCLKKMKKK
ncbi:unnamed protein product, partial [Brachionus calyciflorus]